MPSSHVDRGLRDAHETERVSRYLQELVNRRHYIVHVATGDLRARQMNTILGNAWHLLNPILQVAVYYLIFGLVLDTRRGVDNFITFVAIGVFVFGFTQRSTIAGANSIRRNRGLMASINFPRAMLPLSTTLTETLAYLPTLLVVLPVALLSGEPLRATWLLLLPLLALQALFNAGIAMLAARATTHFPDFEQVLPFVFRLLFYASGIIFSVEAYAGGTSYAWIFDINPIYGLASLGRFAVLGGSADPVWWISSVAWTLALLMIGFVWFRRGENQYGNV